MLADRLYPGVTARPSSFADARVARVTDFLTAADETVTFLVVLSFMSAPPSHQILRWPASAGYGDTTPASWSSCHAMTSHADAKAWWRRCLRPARSVHRRPVLCSIPGQRARCNPGWSEILSQPSISHLALTTAHRRPGHGTRPSFFRPPRWRCRVRGVRRRDRGDGAGVPTAGWRRGCVGGRGCLRPVGTGLPRGRRGRRRRWGRRGAIVSWTLVMSILREQLPAALGFNFDDDGLRR